MDPSTTQAGVGYWGGGGLSLHHPLHSVKTNFVHVFLLEEGDVPR
jgi:hypothetical protein